jgi:tRNA-dihydrouridine synthase
MRDIPLAAAVIGAVVAAVGVPVIVKMRLGWDEFHLNAGELADIARDLGAAAVTIHGRTRNQKYKGRADWPAIGAVARSLTLPVIANGDITGIADARRCLAETGAAGLMIGRAAIGAPWLPGDINRALTGGADAGLTLLQKIRVLSGLYEETLKFYNREAAVRRARTFLAAFLKDLAHGGYGVNPREKALLLTSSDSESVQAALGTLTEHIQLLHVEPDSGLR